MISVIVIGSMVAIYIVLLAYWMYEVIFETVIAVAVLWILLTLMWGLGAFRHFNDRGPTLKEIARMNVLLCIPDLTFIRCLELSSADCYWRIGARVVLTLL